MLLLQTPYLCKKYNRRIMTTLQLNAEMLRLMSVVAEDEKTLKRVVKYLKTVVAKEAAAKQDDSLLSKDEFFAKIDRAHQQVEEGKVTRMLPGETMEDLLRRKGYAI